MPSEPCLNYLFDCYIIQLLRLLKIEAVILRNTRRIRFLLSSAYPYQHLFQTVATRLKPG